MTPKLISRKYGDTYIKNGNKCFITTILLKMDARFYRANPAQSSNARPGQSQPHMAQHRPTQPRSSQSSNASHNPPQPSRARPRSTQPNRTKALRIPKPCGYRTELCAEPWMRIPVELNRIHADLALRAPEFEITVLCECSAFRFCAHRTESAERCRDISRGIG